jgi:hypothetical protein
MKLKTTNASLVFALLVTAGCVDRIHTTPDASPSREAAASDLSAQAGVDAGKDTTTPAVDAVAIPDAVVVPDALAADLVLSQDAAADVIADVGGGVDSQPADVRVAPDAGADVAVVVSDGSVDVAVDVPADSPAHTPDASAGVCQSSSDCPGTCQMCNASHACVAAVSQDDPNARCAGTCDATGACKSKKGQTCQASTDCAGGIPCADGYCCDKACTGSCEACNLAASVGTCTTLAANAVPHASHTACASTDATCAGYCNGSSAACFYPSSACGTPSCTGNTAQAAGTCSNGACAKPAAQTCTNGNTCQASTGTCSCSNTTCGTSCVNLATDPKNCGTCGHDCLGGACITGHCQPAVVASSSTAQLSVIGVDAASLYFQAYDGLTNTAYQVSRTGQGATGSLLDSGDFDTSYLGVIGTKLFLSPTSDVFQYCDINSTDSTHCSATKTALPGAGTLATFKSQTPPAQYFALYDNPTQTEATISWYTTGGTLVKTVTDTPSVAAYSYLGLFAYGDAAYWIRSFLNADLTPLDATVYTASVANPTLTYLTANTLPDIYSIIDANAKSVLLVGPSNGLYRVALPNGTPSAKPALLFSTGSSATILGATEDANAVYWLQSDGTVNSCLATFCQRQILVFNQNVFGDLYQDSSALYWGDSTAAGAGQVMRLAK